MIRRNLVDGRAEAEHADTRWTIAFDAEALEARHLCIGGVIVDAAQKHRLELANRHIVALVPRCRGVREIVRDHIRMLRLCNHARSRDIESSPHSSSLFFPQKFCIYIVSLYSLIFL